ncbi:MAG: zf-HC2 domain-containing protein [Oscillospiraceae bacterium]|nr:zf-HC2 domain-containing protein [Oscillospiraceae bacterium]
MEDCRYFEELISARLDGELTEQEEIALRAHLEECENCRAYRDALRAVTGAEADLPAPPAELTGRIMDAVRREAAPGKTEKIVPLRRYLRPAALAAAAALVIWAGWRTLGPKGSAKTAAAPMAPMAAVSMAAADSAEAEEAAPEEAEIFMAEAAAVPAAGLDTGSEANGDEARDAQADAETPLVTAATADSVNAAAKTEGGCRYILCRGANGEPLSEGTADADALRALLAADKPAEIPDRAADYILTLPDTGENWLLWEEDGGMIIREDGADGAGRTVSAEVFRATLGVAE